VAEHGAVRVRVVSNGDAGLAALLLRFMGASAFVRLDVDWSGCLVVANASLWPLGYGRNAWFWIPGPHLGQRVGVLGVRERLRELVSAWLRRPSDLRVLCFGSDSGMRFRTGLDSGWRGWTVMSPGSSARVALIFRATRSTRAGFASSTPFIVQARAPVALPQARSNSTAISPSASAGVAVPRVGGSQPGVPSVPAIRDPRQPDATPIDDRRPGDYRRGAAVTMPRVETPLAETRRAPETPHARPPERTGVGAPAKPLLATPEPSPQPTHGYRPPPAASDLRRPAIDVTMGLEQRPPPVRRRARRNPSGRLCGTRARRTRGAHRTLRPAIGGTSRESRAPTTRCAGGAPREGSAASDPEAGGARRSAAATVGWLMADG